MRTRAVSCIVMLMFIAVANSAFADPPPHPRFKVTNHTTYPLAGTFLVSYQINDLNRTTMQTEIVVNVGPGGSAERQLPNRISHNIDSAPSIDGVSPKFCTFTLNGAAITWGQGYTCQTKGTQNFSAYNGKAVRLTVTTGSWDVAKQDYIDVYIDW